jgi:hypothetical protein
MSAFKNAHHENACNFRLPVASTESEKPTEFEITGVGFYEPTLVMEVVNGRISYQIALPDGTTPDSATAYLQSVMQRFTAPAPGGGGDGCGPAQDYTFDPRLTPYYSSGPHIDTDTITIPADPTTLLTLSTESTSHIDVGNYFTFTPTAFDVCYDDDSCAAGTTCSCGGR